MLGFGDVVRNRRSRLHSLIGVKRGRCYHSKPATHGTVLASSQMFHVARLTMEEAEAFCEGRPLRHHLSRKHIR